MVASGNVKSESRAHVVYYEHSSRVGAFLAQLLPVSVGGQLVVDKVSVHIRLSDDGSNFPAVFFKRLLDLFPVVPVDVDIVHNVFFEDAGAVDFLCPR